MEGGEWKEESGRGSRQRFPFGPSILHAPFSVLCHPLARWAPVVLWMAVIFYGSSRSVLPRPLSDQSRWGEWLRNLTHVAEYAVLAALSHRAVRNTVAQRAGGKPVAGWMTVVLAFAIAFVYAILDEAHQHFVPGRQFDLLDIGLDTVGAVVGIALRIKN